SLSSYTASGLTEGNTYYWKVVAWNSSSNYSILGPNKITVNKAPILSGFTPEDNKNWYSESAVLSWTATDTDGDSLTYDVYLHECDPGDYPEDECPDEIDPSSMVAEGITATQHTETGLTTNNTIFWKVVARDGYNTTSSSILKFQIKPKYHDWRATTGSQVYVSPSVSGDGRFILLGSSDDEIQLFDYDSGDDGYLWKYDVNQDIYEVAMSKDGNYFAAITEDGANSKLYFYKTNYTDDDADPIQQWTYNWGTNLDHLAISADGSYIVIASDSNHKAMVFDKSSSTPIISVSADNVYDVAISANGQYFATCGNTHVSFYSTSSSTPLWSYTNSGDYGCYSAYVQYGSKLVISDDGNYVAMAASNDRFRAFNASTGAVILNYDSDDTVYSVDISSDGKYIAAVNYYQAYTFELSSATDTYSFKWKSSGSACCRFLDVDMSADGKYFVAVKRQDDYRGIYYFSIDSSTPLWEGKPTPASNWYSVSMSDNGRIIAGTRDYSQTTYVYSWEYASNSFLKQFAPANNSLVNTNVSLMWTAAGEDAKDWVYDVYMDTSANPTTLVSANTTYRNYSATSLTAGTRYYWKVVTKEDGDVVQTSEIWTFKIQQSPTISLSSPLINFTQYHNKVTFVWTGSENLRYLVYVGTESDDLTAQSDTWQSATSLEVSGLDSKMTYYFKVGAFDGTNFIYSEVRKFTVGVNTPIWQYTTSGSNTYATTSAISADGNFSVVGFKDGDVRFYNKTSSTPLWTYTAGSDILDVAISDNGSYIVVGSKDDFVYLFYKTNNSYLWKKDLDGDVSAVAISRDGEYIAAGGKDDKVVFFDKDSSTPVWTSDDLDAQVIRIVMSHNGSYIVAGTEATGAGEVYFFSKSGGGDYDWKDDYGGPVTDVAISKNGENVAITSDDYKVYYYNTTGTELWKHETESKALSVSITDDAEFLAVASQDKNVYLFNTSSSTPLWAFDMGSKATHVEISR
ncbi:MAG TPA: WD40 repeat domain-containing protein, partial [Candidatus Poseidoniia archaeon]|nr:WD40 repeat domain-containing protein [Candidatus Poseidoniia archaeon]